MNNRNREVDDANKRIRVVIQQPALPKYRVAVFRELAGRSGIDLKVIYADSSGVPSVDAMGFDARCVAMREGRLVGRPVYWHTPQWGCASSKTTDVLILTWNLHFASLVPALLRAKINGVKTILWGHGCSKQEAGWRAWLREKVAGLATALLFYNHTVADRFIADGWDRERVYVGLNSLDQREIQEVRESWVDRADDLEAFRRREGLSAGPMVLFVSRLEAANRVDLLIHALSELAEDYPGLQVVIIGKGDEEGSLRSYARSQGVEDRVRFLGAIYDEKALGPWFMLADVYCYPVNIGLSLLHAFGYGLPVVTSDRTEAQNPEIEALRNGENGLVYRDGDASSLAKVLRRVFDDRGLAKRLSAGALSTVMEGFTLRKMVDGMEAAVRCCTRQV